MEFLSYESELFEGGSSRQRGPCSFGWKGKTSHPITAASTGFGLFSDDTFHLWISIFLCCQFPMMRSKGENGNHEIFSERRRQTLSQQLLKNAKMELVQLKCSCFNSEPSLQPCWTHFREPTSTVTLWKSYPCLLSSCRMIYFYSYGPITTSACTVLLFSEVTLYRAVIAILSQSLSLAGCKVDCTYYPHESK